MDKNYEMEPLFDEKDIEQIFGGDSVTANTIGEMTETQTVKQQEKTQELTHASDNLG